ncbi:TetR/AcrR family transcriptional regulator, partial [Mycolicibacterium fortuitum]
MYTGAMAELAQQWLSGNLGDDLEVVVDYALRLVLGAGAAG